MPYTPILATLGYVLSTDGKSVLMVRRDRNPKDHHFGKCNGLGGKLEANEDIVSGMCREIKEEAGIDVTSLVLRGTISWPGFGSKGEDWFGFIFLITQWQGTPHSENSEGTLKWVNLEDISGLPLWEGDKYFLQLVFDRNEKPFHGIMPYQNGKPLRWSRSFADI
jgi:8-oxo-dGTP diphosphatase